MLELRFKPKLLPTDPYRGWRSRKLTEGKREQIREPRECPDFYPGSLELGKPKSTWGQEHPEVLQRELLL